MDFGRLVSLGLRSKGSKCNNRKSKILKSGPSVNRNYMQFVGMLFARKLGKEPGFGLGPARVHHATAEPQKKSPFRTLSKHENNQYAFF